MCTQMEMNKNKDVFEFEPLVSVKSVGEIAHWGFDEVLYLFARTLAYCPPWTPKQCAREIGFAFGYVLAGN